MRQKFFIGIVVAGVVSLALAALGRPDFGNILILAATAWIVAHYTAETRRLGQATEEMAEATVDMARVTMAAATADHGAQLRIIERDDSPSSSGRPHHPCWNTWLRNDGSGKAFAVKVCVEATGEQEEYAGILPADEVQVASGTAIREGSIRVAYSDVLQEYDLCWTWQQDIHRWRREQ